MKAANDTYDSTITKTPQMTLNNYNSLLLLCSIWIHRSMMRSSAQRN